MLSRATQITMLESMASLEGEQCFIGEAWAVNSGLHVTEAMGDTGDAGIIPPTAWWIEAFAGGVWQSRHVAAELGTAAETETPLALVVPETPAGSDTDAPQACGCGTAACAMPEAPVSEKLEASNSGAAMALYAPRGLAGGICRAAARPELGVPGVANGDCAPGRGLCNSAPRTSGATGAAGRADPVCAGGTAESVGLGAILLQPCLLPSSCSKRSAKPSRMQASWSRSAVARSACCRRARSSARSSSISLFESSAEGVSSGAPAFGTVRAEPDTEPEKIARLVLLALGGVRERPMS